MKVCEKCRKKIKEGTIIELLGEDYEICDECTSKIVNWLIEPIRLGLLGGLFKK